MGAKRPRRTRDGRGLHNVEDELYRRARDLELAQRDVRKLAEEARTLGATWARIGALTGASAQTAHYRYRSKGVS